MSKVAWPFREPRRFWRTPGLLAAGCCWWIAMTCAAPAQAQHGVHYRHHSQMPPGAIGSWQLRRGGPLAGYYQPVEIHAPRGVSIALPIEGRLDRFQPAPVLAGMLVAPVYRMRVANIPNAEGIEVFPTLEVIDRLYPPAGQAHRFPIVVELTQEELDIAVSGRMVTRVIYLEDPDQAPGTNDEGQPQRWFDVGPGEDPLQAADAMGRPVAILRMGGRIPADPAAPGQEFLFGSPSWVKYAPRPAAGPAVPAPAGQQPAGQAPVEEVPAPVDGASRRAPARQGQAGQTVYFDAPPRTSRAQELLRR